MKQITTSEIVGEQKQQESRKDRREGKGRVLAISRRVYRLQNTDIYYVESESSDNIYYFVKFKSDVFEWCSCIDNFTRREHAKCKHLFAIEFAIRWRTLIDIDKLPAGAKRYSPSQVVITKQQQKLENNVLEVSYSEPNTNVIEDSSISNNDNDESSSNSSSYYQSRHPAKFEEATRVEPKSSYRDDDYSF